MDVWLIIEWKVSEMWLDIFVWMTKLISVPLCRWHSLALPHGLRQTEAQQCPAYIGPNWLLLAERHTECTLWEEHAADFLSSLQHKLPVSFSLSPSPDTWALTLGLSDVRWIASRAHRPAAGSIELLPALSCHVTQFCVSMCPGRFMASVMGFLLREKLYHAKTLLVC